MNYPEWWEWELDVSSHCLRRMEQRGFNEVDLRAMIADVKSIQEQHHGTFILSTTRDDAAWEVIVVPDHEKRLIVVVTAYAVG